MTPTLDIKPLPHLQRRIIFLCSLVIFAISVPLLVFYAIGYRFDFSDEVTNIKGVGGMYVTSDVREIEMFVDEKPVEDMRIFQNAAYIKNLEAEVHEIHTQSSGLQTWVKKIPVFSHIVTEVESFNMPQVPQIRIVSEYETSTGNAVLFDDATSTVFAFASTSNLFFNATNSATTTFKKNPEWVYIKTLFASSTEKQSLIQAQREHVEEKRFTFEPLASTSTTTDMATTTKKWNDVILFEKEGDVYARWDGKEENIPYYFCIKYKDASTTVHLYGQHVYDGLVLEYGTSTLFSSALHLADRVCRAEIRIDRLWQYVQWFDFFPGSRDKVLMQLQDGLYVVEIDDRSWQNTQLLYPGDYLQVVLDGGRIFVKDGDYYLEVFTTLQQ